VAEEEAARVQQAKLPQQAEAEAEEQPYTFLPRLAILTPLVAVVPLAQLAAATAVLEQHPPSEA
jgi:hypothetical protein